MRNFDSRMGRIEAAVSAHEKPLQFVWLRSGEDRQLIEADPAADRALIFISWRAPADA